VLLFAAMWAIGLGAIVAVRSFQTRVDTARQAQVVVERLQRQVGDLAGSAFNSATAAPGQAPSLVVVQKTLAAGRAAMDGSVATLGSLGESGERARLQALDTRYYASVDQLATLVLSGASAEAAVQYGRDAAATGAEGALLGELRRAGATYSNSASRARRNGAIGTVFSITFVLLAFSLTLGRATRLAREKHHLLEQSRVEALTDALTGLPNRRKLFADMAAHLDPESRPAQLAIGMFDLDGFKAYNDTFGHPAGDALLARSGERLAAAMAGKGVAYRMGGDEFCVIVTTADPLPVFDAAAAALSEHGAGFVVTCSYGSVVVAPDHVTLEEALQRADQRLYENKRAPREVAGREVHDVLLSVLAENSLSLASHVTNVGRLAEAVARQMGLPEDEVVLVRETAELHDVGKAAIPSNILDKPGPLDEREWELMRRHTIVGERILNAAPALWRIAPLVRSTHEWVDGSGYPDGLSGGKIPLSSRIVAVVDAYDAMTHRRPYSLPVLPERAIEELNRCAGTQFDPDVVAAFVAVQRKLDEAAHSGVAHTLSPAA